ncbi:MAG: PHP-associated domain-containing protein [Candidatus Odinarchaeia archaeon]
MIKIDLHVHTYYSKCALNSPKEVLDTAYARGLNGVAITDHNTLRGYFKAIKENRKQDFIIIPGIEVSSKDGDILGLGVEEIIPRNLSAQETLDKIKESGGICVIPHPFDFLRKSVGFKIRNLKPHAIEVINSNIVFPLSNMLAYRYAKSHKLPMTAGSDAHSVDTVGLSYILVNASSVDEILNAIKKNEVKVRGKDGSIFVKLKRKALARAR